MQLTDDDLQQFMAAWREEFNESITAEEARDRAKALLDLYAILTVSAHEDS
jgi:hypothetical protein